MKSFESRMRVCAYPAVRDTINIVDEADAIRLAIEADKLIKPPCKWTPYPSDSPMPGCHDTSCGTVNYLSEGGLVENGYKFCPYCGGEIEEAKHVSN